jgi:hypothetical protein
MTTAEIRWLSPDEGGLLRPPTGPRYSTVARFEGQTDEEWRKEAWSLVLDFQGTPDESGRHIVAMRFLSEEGPAQRLSPSRTFALFEGAKKVAEGIVLGEPR